MNLQKYFGAITLILSLGTASAFAHHHELGTAAALFEEAEELQHMVSYSSLSHSVKYAAYDFDMAAGQLNHCVPPEPEPGPGPGPVGINHHHEMPDHCREIFYRVREKFSQLDYYSYELQYYPQIFQQYQDTRAALDAIEG